MIFFRSLAFATCLILAASAQTIQIGSPQTGQKLSAGKNVTVEVDRPNSLTGSTEVAIVIAMHTCTGFNCSAFAPTDVLGSILYSGPYNPQYHTGPGQGKPPHQNFSVAVPSSFQKGKARMSVTHLSLVGAGPFALYETRNVSVVVN